MSAVAFGVQLLVGLQKAWISVAVAPMTTVVQVAMPLAMITMVTVIRQNSPPQIENPCSFPQQKMPNEGSLVFMQSLTCSSSSSACYEAGDNASKAADKAEKMFENLQKHLTPVMNNPSKMQAVMQLPKVVKAVASVAKQLQDPELKAVLSSSLQLGSFFKDRAAVERYFTEDLSLPKAIVEAFFNATLNLSYFLKAGKIPSSRDVVCNASYLQKFLQFPKDAPSTEISAALCRLNGSKIANLTELLQSQLSAQKLIKMVASLSRLGGGFNVSAALLDTARLLEFLPRLQSMLGSKTASAATSLVAQLLRLATSMQNSAGLQLQALAKQMQQLQAALDASLGNNSAWLTARGFLDPMTAVLKLLPLAERFARVAQWPQPQLQTLAAPKLVQLLKAAAPKNAMALLTAKITFVQLPLLVQHLLLKSSAHTILCVNPGIVGLVDLPVKSVRSQAYSAQLKLCELKGYELKGDLQTFLHGTKIQQLAARFTAELPTAKDWSEAIAVLSALPQTAAALKLMQPVLQQVPNALAALAKVFNSTNPILESVPFFTLFENVLTTLPKSQASFLVFFRDAFLGVARASLRHHSILARLDAYLKKNAAALKPVLEKAAESKVFYNSVLRAFFFDDMMLYMGGVLPKFFLTERHCHMVLRAINISMPSLCNFRPDSALMRLVEGVRKDVAKDMDDFNNVASHNASFAFWTRAVSLATSNLFDPFLLFKNHKEIYRVLKTLGPFTPSVYEIAQKIMQYDIGTSVLRFLDKNDMPFNMTTLIQSSLLSPGSELLKYKAILDRLENNSLPAAFLSTPTMRLFANSLMSSGPALLRIFGQVIADPNPLLKSLNYHRLCVDLSFSQLLRDYNKDNFDLRNMSKALCDLLGNSSSLFAQEMNTLFSWMQHQNGTSAPALPMEKVFALQMEVQEQVNFLVMRIMVTLPAEIPGQREWLAGFASYETSLTQLGKNSSAMALAINQMISLVQFLPYQSLPTSSLVSLTNALKATNVVLSKGTPSQLPMLRSFTSALVAAMPDLVSLRKIGGTFPWPQSSNFSTCRRSSHSTASSLNALLAAMCMANAHGNTELPTLYAAITKALLAKETSAGSRMVAMQDLRAAFKALNSNMPMPASDVVARILPAVTKLSQAFLNNQTWLDSFLPLYFDIVSVVNTAAAGDPSFKLVSYWLTLPFAVTKIMNKHHVLTRLTNGSSLAEALLPSAALQSALSQLSRSLPDLMDAQAALLSDQNAMRTFVTAVSSGGMPCLNFTFSSILPSAFRARLQPLDAAVCGAVQQLVGGAGQAELLALYGPLMQALSPNISQLTPMTTGEMAAILQQFQRLAASPSWNLTLLARPFLPSADGQKVLRDKASNFEKVFVSDVLSRSSLLAGQVMSMAEAADSKNPVWRSMAASMEIQSDFYRFIAQKLEDFMKGTSIPGSVSTSPRYQLFLRSLVAAAPDALEAHLALLKLGFSDLLRTVQSGGNICVNYTLTDLLPTAYKSRPALKNLSEAICDLVHNPGPLVNQLQGNFEPIIKLFMPAANTTTRAWSDIVMGYAAFQNAITRFSLSIESLRNRTAAQLLGSLAPLLQPSVSQRIMASFAALQAHFLPGNSTNQTSHVYAVLRSQLGPFMALTEQLLAGNPALMTARISMEQQVHVMRFLLLMAQKLNNGSSLVNTFLPSAALQSALSQLSRSLPDLMDAQAALLSDQNAMRTFAAAVSGGGMPCLNFTFSSILPSAFRARLQPLDAAICGAMQQLVGGAGQAELLAQYMSLMQMFVSPVNSSSRSLVLIYDEYFRLNEAFSATVTQFAVNLRPDLLLKPFEQLMVASNQTSLLARLIAIEQKYKGIANLSLPLNTSHSLFLALGQMYTVVDVALAKDHVWMAVKQNLGAQVAVMALINAKIEAVKNGSTFPSTIIKQPQVLSAVEALTQAMPDILEVQLKALNNSTLLPALAQGIMAAVTSKTLCLSVFLHTLLPADFRARAAVLQLDKQLCSMLANLNNVTVDLTEHYKPLMNVFNSTAATPVDWSVLVAQTARLSSNLLSLAELGKNPQAWRPLVDLLSNPQLLQKWKELNATDPVKAATSSLVSAYLTLNAQLGTNPQWLMVRGWLAAFDKLLGTVNSRLTRMIAEKNFFAAVTETAALRSVMDALMAALPDLASRATVQNIAQLSAQLYTRLAANQSFCLGFRLDDVMAAELRSAKTKALSDTLCQAMMQIPAITKEFTQILTMFQPNASLDMNALVMAAQTTASLVARIPPEGLAYLRPLMTLASNDSIDRFKQFLRRAENTTLDASMLASIQQILKALENPPTGNYTKAAFAILNDVERIFTSLWSKVKGANYNITALFRSEQTLRLVETFNKYPQIVQAILETSADLMNNPSKLNTFATQYQRLCIDPNLFKQLVSVPAGQNAADLQKLICGLAMTNSSLLMAEMMGLVPEVALLMQKIVLMSAGLPSDSFNVSAAATKYMSLFSEIAAATPRIQAGLSPALFNQTLLLNLLGPSLAKVQAAAMPSGVPIAQVLAKYQAGLLPLLLPLVNSTLGADTLTRIMTGLKAVTELALGGYTGLQTELNTTVEGRKLLQVLQGVSPFMSTLMHTAVTNPAALAHLSSDLIAAATRPNATAGLGLLCAANLTAMQPPPGFPFDAGAFVKIACSLQMSAMPRSLQQLMSVFMPTSITPLTATEMGKIFSQASQLASSLSAAINGSRNPLTSWMTLYTGLNIPSNLTLTNRAPTLAKLPHDLIAALNAFLPLVNGTPFGLELHRALGAALMTLEIAVKELEAWSSHTMLFKDLLRNDTAVAALMQQLGAPASQVQTLMRVPMKPKELLAVVSKADVLSTLCSRGFASIFASNSSAVAAVEKAVCKASDTAAFATLRAALIVAPQMTPGVIAGPVSLLALQQRVMQLQALVARAPTFNIFTDLAGLAEAVSKLSPAEQQKLQANFATLANASMDWINGVLLQWAKMLNGTAATQQIAQQIRLLALLQTSAQKNLFKNGTAASATAFVQWFTSNFGQLARSFPMIGNGSAVITQVESYLGLLGQFPAQIEKLLQQKPPKPETIAQLTSSLAQGLANLHSSMDPSTHGITVKVLQFAASLLEKVPTSGSALNLTALVSEAALQRAVISGSLAAEQTLLVTKTQQFLALAASSSSPSTVFCNVATFNSTFGQPNPDPETLRQLLCNASRTGDLQIWRMIRHFKLPQLLQSMSVPFDAALSKAVSGALEKLLPELLKIKSVDLWGFAKNFFPALQKYMTGAALDIADKKAMRDTFQMGCSLAYSALSLSTHSSRRLPSPTTLPIHLSGPQTTEIFSNAIDSWLEWTKTTMQMLTALPEATCLFSSGNFAGGIAKVLKDFDSKKLTNPSLTDCSRRADAFLSIATTSSDLQRSAAADWLKVPACLQELPKTLGDLSKGLEQLQALLQNISTTGITVRPEEQELLKWIGDNVGANRKVAVSFQRLFGMPDNQTIIGGLVGALINNTDALLKTAVQVDTKVLASLSTSNLRTALCDPSKLQALFRLPIALHVDYRKMAAVLCSAANTELQGLLSALNLAQSLSSMQALGTLSSLAGAINSLSTTMSDIQKLALLPKDLQNANIASLLRHFADLEQKVLAALEKQSLPLVMNTVADLFTRFQAASNNTAFLTVMEDLKNVTRLLGSFKSLSVLIPVHFQIRMFFVDTKALEAFLKEEGLTEKAINGLLDAKLTLKEIALLAERIDVGRILCNSSLLGQALELDKSISNRSYTLQNLSANLCQEKLKHKIPEIVEQMVKNASIANYVQASFSVNMKKVMEASGVTVKEMQTTLTELKNMGGLMDSMANMPAIDTSTDISSVTQSGDTQMVSKISKAMCGSESAIGTGDSNSGGSQFLRRRRRSATQKSPQQIFCDSLISSMSKSTLGKLLVALMRPLLHGKILVTPDSPAARAVMDKVNATFKELSDLSSLGLSLSAAMDGLSGGSGNPTAAREAMNSPLIKSLFGSALGGSGDSITQLQSLMSGSKTMQMYAGLLGNLTSCVLIDRIRFYSSETDKTYVNDFKKEFLGGALAAINFKNLGGSSATLPKHVTYTLRMGTKLAAKTKELYEKPFPMSKRDIQGQPYMLGFSQLQAMIERGIIALHTGRNLSAVPNIQSSRFPLPCEVQENFIRKVGKHVIPMMIAVSFMCPFLMTVRDAMQEREIRMERFLFAVGRSAAAHWMTWFVQAMLQCVLLAAILTVVFHFAKVLSYINGWIIFLSLVGLSWSLIFFAYLVAAFFSKTSVALLCGIMLFFISYVPYCFATSIISINIPLQAYHASLALPLMPLAFMSLYWTGYQLISNEFSWAHMHSVEYLISPSWCLAALFLDGLGYLFVGWFVRNVFGGKHGVSHPPWFFLLPSFWGFDRRSKRAGRSGKNPYMTDSGSGSGNSGGSGENLCSVKIRNLTKKDGKKTRVKNISLDMYQDQVTVLLGPNGAGKSTTIDMLVGMTTPSSGSITIEGLDRKDQSNTLRKMTGICMQEDRFFPDMSTKENVKYFASFRCSYTKKESKVAVKQLLEQLGLWSVRKTPARDLSGGQKRRLCIALAFIGDPRFIVLDEPTSGVDPSARRAIWNLIASRKAGRTILLCTHHMDEAEIVGDRIAIMNKGSLVACENPVALREKFGCRYLLSLSFESNASPAQREEVVQAARKTNSQLKVEDSNSEEITLSVRLGQGDQDLSRTLDPLEAAQDSGVLRSIGVTFLALETVFTEAIRESEPQAAVSIDDRQDSQLSFQEEQQSRSCLQAFVLLYKQILHTVRSWRTYLAIILMPAIFIAITFASTFVIPKFLEYPAVLLTPSMYGPQAKAFVKTNPNDSAASLFVKSSLLNNPGVGTVCMANQKYLDKRFGLPCLSRSTAFVPRNLSAQEAEKYASAKPCSCNAGKISCPSNYSRSWPTAWATAITRDRLMLLSDHQSSISDFLSNREKHYLPRDILWGGFEFGNGTYTAWYNDKGYHTQPSFYNSMSNILLRSLMAGSNGTAAKDYGISAYAHPVVDHETTLSNSDVATRMIDVAVGFCIVLAITMIPVSLGLRTMGQRLNKEKFLQIFYGVSPLMYWMTNFLWDVLCCGIGLAVVALLVFAFKVPSFYANQNFEATLVTVIVYTVSVLPITYFVSRFCRTEGYAFLLVYTGLTLTALVQGAALIMIAMTATNAENNTNRIIELIFMINPGFCGVAVVTRLSKNQVTADILKAVGIDSYKSPFTMGILGEPCIFLAAEWFLFFVLNLLADVPAVQAWFEGIRCRVLCRRKKTSIKYTHREGDISKEDQTVFEERTRVEQNPGDPLVIQNLSKNFFVAQSKIRAVQNVSFGLVKGECFGLLGCNGAGKTSLFRCVTGDLQRYAGTIRLLGRRAQRIGNHVGYCPQVDPLDPLLTVRETLSVYAMLRGVRGAGRNLQIDQLLSELDLSQNQNQLVKKLSGGTRRKVSLAVALLGSPELLLLDEPTAGVDAASKRRVWAVLERVRSRCGVLLTSHSMEEMQRLATRLALLVNGNLRTIGSCAQLKATFGSTITVTVWLQPELTDPVTERLRANFPGSEVKTRRGNVAELAVPAVGTSLAAVFQTMTSLRRSGVRAFSLQHTSLEQIFLQLTEEQHDGMEDSEVSSNYDLCDSSGRSESIQFDSLRKGRVVSGYMTSF